MLSNCRHNICCCRIASRCSYNSCSFSGITGRLGRVGVLGSPVAIPVAVGGGTVLACSSTMSLLPSASSCSSGAFGASGGGSKGMVAARFLHELWSWWRIPPSSPLDIQVVGLLLPLAVLGPCPCPGRYGGPAEFPSRHSSCRYDGKDEDW